MKFLQSLFGWMTVRPQPVSSTFAPLQMPARPVPHAQRRQSGVAYDPTLVECLKDEHQELLSLFGRLQAAAHARDAQACRRFLGAFSQRLHDHQVTENTKLYLYVKAAMETADPRAAAVARKFQLEMSGLVKRVLAFAGKYSSHPTRLDIDALERDLQGIGRLLVEQVTREEQSLYPLYVPSRVRPRSSRAMAL